MKKLLVGTAAIAMGLSMAAPAHAQLQLGVAGHFKGYVSWDSQDTTAGSEERHLDLLRDTEVHFTGETTLDNGLTVGVHVEALADAGDGFAVDESYAYFSGAWGRVNLGDEDGAAYLLQVAAPSADSNVDGIRQYVNPVNYGITTASLTPAIFGVAVPVVGLSHLGNLGAGELDYANDATRRSDKLTYLSPVFGGVQFGLSYTPTVTTDGTGLPPATSRSFGSSIKDAADTFGSAYEASARWEGTWNNVGFNLGGGYTMVKLENDGLGLDDFKQWNVGADLNLAAFGLGAVYTTNNEAGIGGDGNDEKTYVVGADYTTGPFKLGASWLHDKMEGMTPALTGGDVKTNRYSGGVVYTFAPGMSFRGSVGAVRTDVDDADNADADYALLGTQINF